MKSRPVLILAAVSAAATALTGVLATIPGVPVWVVPAVAALGTVATAIGGVLANEATALKSESAPWQTVAAQRMPDGSLLAGPAAPGLTQEGDVVDVLRPGPTY